MLTCNFRLERFSDRGLSFVSRFDVAALRRSLLTQMQACRTGMAVDG